MRPFFVTIDTEGDNVWLKPKVATTRNALFLRRFQRLCERYSVVPTYLVNYEMATCSEFVELASNALMRNRCEIGMHLHAWNSPPVAESEFSVDGELPILAAYPKETIFAKVQFMTRLLESVFQKRPIVHRAGRWVLSQYYVDALIDNGYYLDCSVTPGVGWEKVISEVGSDACFDYVRYEATPGSFRHSTKSSKLISLPMSIGNPWRLGPVQRVWGAHRLFPSTVWLRPNRRSCRPQLALLNRLADSDAPYAMFMLHSSELMAGGSPSFRTERDIDLLYRKIERIFQRALKSFVGMSMGNYRNRFGGVR